jgi:hypothetical protein
MTTFTAWRELQPARETVAALTDLDISKFATWDDYIIAVYNADLSDLRARAEQLGSVSSDGQFSVLLAVLWSMDYSALAVDLERSTNRSFLACMNRTTGASAKAVSGVFSRL